MGLFNIFRNNKNLTPYERRAQTIRHINKLGLSCNENLPVVDNNVITKNVEQIKKRALACILSVQLACSINNGENYYDSLAYILQMMDNWELTLDDFLPKERLLIENKITKKDCNYELTNQDIIDIIWTYETYWVLIWALDLITNKELKDATKVCNTERAMAIAGVINDIDLKLRSTDKILDMVDLFYCYHWFCNEKKINPKIDIKKLNPEVVLERRRGLEWLISSEFDWYNISLDA